MASADVVVVGAGLAGLTAAVALADAGATVEVVAAGHAATHWTAGGIDIAGGRGAATSSEGLAALAAVEGHPYGGTARLAGAVADGLEFVRGVLAGQGLEYVGGLDDVLLPVPTAIGGTRQAAILPAAQAAALQPWAPDERLVVCGPAAFKDFWPAAIAASLARPGPWGGASRPAQVDALVVDWPGVAERRNLNALVLARLFDDPEWREAALAIVARAVDRLRGPARVAVPAVLGTTDHAGVLADIGRIVPAEVFEVALVPPSIPGIRLFGALRAVLRRRGGRIVVGESALRVETAGRQIRAVIASAAARERTIGTGALVLATGGIAGGGLIGREGGTLVEPLLHLPVEAPAAERWLADDPFDPAGHPLERAGIRTDAALRPLDAAGRVVFDNVAVVGSMLAGQRSIAERCGDGVAIASGWLAAQRLGGTAAGGTATALQPGGTAGRGEAGTGRTGVAGRHAAEAARS